MASLSDKDHHITSFYHEDHGGSSPSSDQGSYGYDHDYQKSSVLLDEEANSLMEKTNSTTATDVIVNHGTTTTFHTPVGPTDLGFRPHNGHQHSLINFKNGDGRSDCFGHSTAAGSFLSFQQDHKNIDSFLCGSDNNVNGIMGCYSNTSYNSRQVISNDLKGGSSESRLFDDINSYQPASSSYGWLYSDATVVAADRVQETGAQEGSTAVHKRPYKGDQRSIQTSKKQCTGTAKNSKPKPVPSTKDPQSIAAKNRRERISERLKILQELVPNGPKVDLVTMLEKAISYVKFLQLQVKVLATDEFWPAQGGKAPDISQVKEAIDAILASQRDRSSSSK